MLAEVLQNAGSLDFAAESPERLLDVFAFADLDLSQYQLPPFVLLDLRTGETDGLPRPRLFHATASTTWRPSVNQR
jgi:hypothetical protein